MASAKQTTEELAQDVSVWATEMQKKYFAVNLAPGTDINAAISQLETLTNVLKSRVRKAQGV